jgi:hypothetical protein
VFHPHAPVLLPVIIGCVGDPFYKISSEALLVLESLVKVLRPLDQPTNFNFQPYTNSVSPRRPLLDTAGVARPKLDRFVYFSS